AGCLGSALAVCGFGFGAGLWLNLHARPDLARRAGFAVAAAAVLLAVLPEWNGGLVRLLEGAQ
ncbi:MAG: hypothetical protein EBS01_13580, partial [Verrucomicrobia bacterium]|nr:hypothetical protein [Verrucomicrobiota bacterium]